MAPKAKKTTKTKIKDEANESGCEANRPGRPQRRLFGPEATMRDTIECLLGLPPSMRDQLEMAENFTFTRTGPAPSIGSVGGSSSLLVTLPAGSVESAQALLRKGFRPALLNFAHSYNCGGGFEHAGGSQEEDIFRKTSLFLSLWPHRRSDDGPGRLARGTWIGDYDEDLPRKEPFYEHTECGAIYSPHVCAVRNTSVRDIPLLDASSSVNWPTFAVITAAAQNVSRDPPFDSRLLHEKVRTILWLAASHGHDSIVLGAFGCGYFSNPPDVVADTFRNLLSSGGEFENVFRVVVFGVVHGNVRHFSKVFPLMEMGSLPKAEQSHSQLSDEMAKQNLVEDVRDDLRDDIDEESKELEVGVVDSCDGQAE